jgi:hypothetical protein
MSRVRFNLVSSSSPSASIRNASRIAGRRFSIPVAIVLGLAAVPLLAGCVGNPVTGIVSGATGGKVDVGGTSIPSDFPKTVPLYKGTVSSVTAIGSGSHKVYNVAIQVSGPVAMTSIESALTAAGFKTVVAGSIGKVGASLISTGTDYTVAVVLAKAGKGYEADYTVTPSAGTS